MSQTHYVENEFLAFGDVLSAYAKPAIDAVTLSVPPDLGRRNIYCYVSSASPPPAFVKGSLIGKLQKKPVLELPIGFNTFNTGGAATNPTIVGTNLAKSFASLCVAGTAQPDAILLHLGTSCAVVNGAPESPITLLPLYFDGEIDELVASFPNVSLPSNGQPLKWRVWIGCLSKDQ